MNKKFIISLGLMAALTISTAAVMAESTIYTDGIGRLHFLGRDAANNKAGHNYSNSAEQDLTRKLYEQSSGEVVNDTSYDQHPVKNYENTFPDSRFGTTKYWKTKYSNGADDVAATGKSVKATATATRGKTDYSTNQYGSTILENDTEQNVTPVKTTKKHWWNKNK